MATKIVELEIDSADNASLFFRPLGRKLRGRLEWRRCKNPLAAVTGQSWGDVPGQRVRVDFDAGRAAVLEPIQSEPGCAGLRQKIEKAGLGLAPAEETFPLDENGLATWCFWLRRATEDGNARILSGALPEKLAGKARLDFGPPRPEDPRDRMLSKLVEIVSELLPAAKKRELLSSLAE